MLQFVKIIGKRVNFTVKDKILILTIWKGRNDETNAANFTIRPSDRE